MIPLEKAISFERIIRDELYTITLSNNKEVLNIYMFDNQDNPYKCVICNKEILTNKPIFRNRKDNYNFYNVYCSKKCEMIDEL